MATIQIRKRAEDVFLLQTWGDWLRHEQIVLLPNLPDKPRPSVGVQPTFFRLKWCD
jgi:hypothetical protein